MRKVQRGISLLRVAALVPFRPKQWTSYKRLWQVPSEWSLIEAACRASRRAEQWPIETKLIVIDLFCWFDLLGWVVFFFCFFFPFFCFWVAILWSCWDVAQKPQVSCVEFKVQAAPNIDQPVLQKTSRWMIWIKFECNTKQSNFEPRAWSRLHSWMQVDSLASKTIAASCITVLSR